MNTLLEIRSDRLSEKGVFVAAQMLDTLHGTLHSERHFWERDETPTFTFEIAQIGGALRFFMIVNSADKDLVIAQIYAHYPTSEIIEIEEYIPSAPIAARSRITLTHDELSPIKTYTDFKDRSEKEAIDPYSPLTSSLLKASREETLIVRVSFRAVSEKKWKSEAIVAASRSKLPTWVKKLLKHSITRYIKLLVSPVTLVLKGIALLIPEGEHSEEKEQKGSKTSEDFMGKKVASFGFATAVEVIALGKSESAVRSALSAGISGLNIFSLSGFNSFRASRAQKSSFERIIERKAPLTSGVLSSAELAGLVHLPTMYVKTPWIQWVASRKFEPPHNLPTEQEAGVTILGTTDFRGVNFQFGIRPSDRARHTYIIGKTGMGKSTLLENMIYDDMARGNGVAIIDPHGDLAQSILSLVPKNRTNDVIVFDPTDTEFPVAFNMMENVAPDLQPLVASGLVGIFKRIFGESWGPRLEYILRNTVLSLLQAGDATLISIPMMLTQKSFRLKVVSKLTDPLLKKYWESEFDAMSPSAMQEAISPILNKVGQFLSSPLMRNILGQPKNPFSLRWAMDNRKIVVINLSKWRLGEDSSWLLGAMLVTKFQIDAMSRADIAEKDRKEFYLYVDEFQNFATESFATILSEARKYKLGLVMANQYVSQMPEPVRDAVFGNVGTMISFQVGPQDAPELMDAFGGEDVVTANDLMNLPKHTTYTKLLVDGMPTPIFSTRGLSPVHSRVRSEEQKAETLRKVSREKYARERSFVEKKIYEYSNSILEAEKKFQEEGKRRSEEAKARKSEEAKAKRTE